MFWGRGSVGAPGDAVPLVHSWDQAEEPGILRAAELALGTVPEPVVTKVP